MLVEEVLSKSIYLLNVIVPKRHASISPLDPRNPVYRLLIPSDSRNQLHLRPPEAGPLAKIRLIATK